MAWQGKSLTEICQQIKDPKRNGNKTLEMLHEHMADDELVGWGWMPGVGRDPAPGDRHLQFSAPGRKRPCHTARFSSIDFCYRNQHLQCTCCQPSLQRRADREPETCHVCFQAATRRHTRRKARAAPSGICYPVGSRYP
jgi:hypothetical protein